VATLVGDEAVEWANAKDIDVDDEGNVIDTNSIALPSLPFDGKTKPNKAFARKLKGWFKDCLSK
jgi:hypothetical protein